MRVSPEATERVRLGISSCLLGEAVRFDGGHKKDDFLLNTLGAHVSWVPVCPEVEIGLGTPRESIHLSGDPDSPRLVAPRSGSDHTDPMKQWSERRLDELSDENLDGYVLKKDSPSCGLLRVRVYHDNGQITRNGVGIYARELTARFPLLPVEEEGRLRDPRLRENFVERVFAYNRWRAFLSSEPGPRELVAFHTKHKLTVMSHSPAAQRQMGQLVARAGDGRFSSVLDDYGVFLMAALLKPATPRRHANVLQHAMGFLRGQIDRGDREELLDMIERYRTGLIPLIVPITLLHHHLRRLEVPDWLRSQVYLNPYPAELMLRNHV